MYLAGGSLDANCLQSRSARQGLLRASIGRLEVASSRDICMFGYCTLGCRVVKQAGMACLVILTLRSLWTHAFRMAGALLTSTG